MSNTVKLIIDKSPIHKLPPGKIIDWNIQDADLLPSIGKVEINIIVILGNKQYRSGTRLTLYLNTSLPVS